MRIWTEDEVSLVLRWAQAEDHDRGELERLAAEIGRSTDAIIHFLRRILPPDERPWRTKPRWSEAEANELRTNGNVSGRSPGAIEKYAKRHGWEQIFRKEEPEQDDPSELTVKQAAKDTGLPRPRVYKLIRRGLLRRFKRGIALASFKKLLKKHPEEIPFDKLDRDRQDYLMVMGYKHPTMRVKMPSAKGLLR